MFRARTSSSKTLRRSQNSPISDNGTHAAALYQARPDGRKRETGSRRCILKIHLCCRRIFARVQLGRCETRKPFCYFIISAVLVLDSFIIKFSLCSFLHFPYRHTLPTHDILIVVLFFPHVGMLSLIPSGATGLGVETPLEKTYQRTPVPWPSAMHSPAYVFGSVS